MYVPAVNAITDRAEIVAMVRRTGAGELVTVSADGMPVASLLPVLWDGGDVLTAHLARANPHWRSISDGAAALVIVTGPQSYISPSWYPRKAVDGRVVPTWNYSSAHLSGSMTLHHDPQWLRTMVTQLTEQHEGARSEPWAVTDAPAEFVDRMLQAIVGVELHIDRVEAKAKLSQNRPVDDQLGVIAGLRREGGDEQVAAAMAAALDERQP